ncbi:VOC family protein [Mycobacterium bourgelatii]|uniref:VOC domain-containing protein n=1 Tax=Mycobacterium bourgelatii TaxID=1273442 RepID=A0A7I9YKI0_MYCBU|nr:VOC family protein [Mycobacterium bourgelatii]MCV6974661.1 VOC family protein [Mycobacterium bourgelatii]GFG89128.1 hypothetical protein MBOU_11700 [Mycobacterium bourgelatii]
MTARLALTHIGLCVSDIESSAVFYCAALGFEEVRRMRVANPETATLLGVPGLVLDLVYLQRDGFRLELLGYPVPGVHGDGQPRQLNALGFTHLSFRVDDPDGLVSLIERYGGKAWADRTVAFAGGSRGLMATDPDGNWIELIESRPAAAD